MKCDKTNRRKTLDEFALEAEGNEEEASLSLFDLLCIGIGGTVGSGVFVLTGEVYPVAGPSSALCWMIAGGVCLLSAFSYIRTSSSPACFKTSELGGPRSREDGRPDHRACLPPPERNVLARPRILARDVCHHRRGPIRHQH